LNLNSISNQKLLEIIGLQTEIAQQGTDLSSIMDLVTERSQHITDADGASIELLEKAELVYSATSGIANRFLGLRLEIANSLSGECIRDKTPLISNDIETDERVNKEACRQIGLNSMIVVPLVFHDRVVGILKVLSTETGHFDDNDIKILKLMSDLFAAAMFTAMRNEESELFYKATHDSLTGISNRSVFYDRLRSKLSISLRKHENFGIISLDLDGLKEINDYHGHPAGDAAIKETALRICKTTSESDTVSRLGGDEFGIIASGIADREAIRAFILRMDHEITMPFQFEGHKINLRASIGYALFSEDGIKLEMLIEKADKSMYAVKRARKGAENVR
jgi:diguanylate cyclase (GGDEF)-like protein